MRRLIAVDVDDVVAYTTEALWRWANEVTGKNLTLDDYRVKSDSDYWNYYDSIWESHGMNLKKDDVLSLDSFGYDPSLINLVPGAKEALTELAEDFDIVFVTSRDSASEDVTKQWLKDQLGKDATVYFASAGHHDYGKDAPSKGEIVKTLGAELLVDDNPEHVQSALDHGVEAILFGDYGWQIDAPSHLNHIKTWSEVLEYIKNGGRQ